LDKVGDDQGPIGVGDFVGDSPLVGFEPRGHFDVSQLPSKVLELFVMLGHDVSLCQDLLVDFSKLVVELGHVTVDSGDEAIGGGVDSVTEVFLLEE